MRILKIATRQSPLALWQAEHVKGLLQRLYPNLTVELVKFVTQGDKMLDTPLAKMGGKGLFVKELEAALLTGRADLAVHSMKDVPMLFPEGLCLAAIVQRENPFDAFVSNTFSSFQALPQGAVVGTSSLRRTCQLRAARPDLIIKNLRGNVGTRLGKLDAGEYDAIILAAAGLIRLDLTHRITQILDDKLSLPAVGQGAVGIECRVDDVDLQQLLAPLNHAETTVCVQAERAFNARLMGGCQVPIAGYAVLQGDKLHLRGRVGRVDGAILLHDEINGHLAEATALGETLATRLLNQGADKILAQLYAGDQDTVRL